MLPAWMIADIKKQKDDEFELRIGEEIPYTYKELPDDSDDEDVLDFGSGGGPSAPPPPDPQAEAKAQMELEAERARIAEEQRVAEEKRKAADLAQQKEQFQSRLGSAYTQAQNYGTTRLNALGIRDDFGILPAYYGELDRARASVPELDPNPGNYFGPALFESALGTSRDAQRRKLTSRYETEVPEGYEQTFIPDTADDALINAIIGEQYGEANQFLQRARDRGQLNDVGYDTAYRGLNQARSGATARAQEMGSGVLESGREELRGIDKAARKRIADYDFGDAFDPDSYEGRIRSTAGSFTSGLEGRLRNSFGGTEFFDPDSLILKGGKAQGPINPGAAALTGAMTEEERKRLGGSVGAF